MSTITPFNFSEVLGENGLELISYIQKYVSVTVYCSGKKDQWYAVTYDDMERDLEYELLTEIEIATSDICSPIRETHGYAETPVENVPIGAPIYENIEVDTL